MGEIQTRGGVRPGAGKTISPAAEGPGKIRKGTWVEPKKTSSWKTLNGEN